MSKSPRIIEMGPGTLVIGASEAICAMEHQVLEATLKPDAKHEKPMRVLSGDYIPGTRSESWTLSGKLAQDTGEEDSVQDWLFDHRGQEYPFEFTPRNARKQKFQGNLIVEATAIGGQSGTKPDTEFEFELVGAPIRQKLG